jgi:hypothetical protein
LISSYKSSYSQADIFFLEACFASGIDLNVSSTLRHITQSGSMVTDTIYSDGIEISTTVKKITKADACQYVSSSGGSKDFMDCCYENADEWVGNPFGVPCQTPNEESKESIEPTDFTVSNVSDNLKVAFFQPKSTQVNPTMSKVYDTVVANSRKPFNEPQGTLTAFPCFDNQHDCQKSYQDNLSHHHNKSDLEIKLQILNGLTNTTGKLESESIQQNTLRNKPWMKEPKIMPSLTTATITAVQSKPFMGTLMSESIISSSLIRYSCEVHVESVTVYYKPFCRPVFSGGSQSSENTKLEKREPNLTGCE